MSESRRRIHMLMDQPNRNAQRDEQDACDYADSDSYPAKRAHLRQLALAVNLFIWIFFLHHMGIWG